VTLRSEFQLADDVAMATFTDLKAWQTGLELVKEIYFLTKKFPRDEFFGLTTQIRRSCTSILANLAEGSGRYTYRDKAGKYTIARGECTETEALLLTAIGLKFINTTEATKALELVHQTGRLTSGLIRSCKNHS
jgi:four helix bundle protein